MADTIRQLIMSNLVTRFKNISLATGYSADYGYIDEWRLTPLSVEEYPAIILVDSGQDKIEHDRLKTDWWLNLTVSIFAKGDESPEQLRNYQADVHKCLAVDLTCGGNAGDIEPVDDVTNFLQKDDVYGNIDMHFRIFYSHNAWDLTTAI